MIAIVDADRPAHQQILAQVPWDALIATVGARWTPQGLSPERWRVGADGFPTAAELARLARVAR